MHRGDGAPRDVVELHVVTDLARQRSFTPDADFGDPCRDGLPEGDALSHERVALQVQGEGWGGHVRYLYSLISRPDCQLVIHINMYCTKVNSKVSELQRWSFSKSPGRSLLSFIVRNLNASKKKHRD